MGKAIVTVQPSFTNQQLNSIAPNPDVDPFFLYYTLCTRRRELFSLGSATGVRTPILNKTAFSNLEVPLPPVPTQQKIAAILSAYDDLIENNLRRIKVLEEMAQLIYREWYVNFRFPGHEKVELVDSVLGLIPKQWVLTEVTEAVEVNPRYAVPKEGEKPFIAMTCLSNDSMVISNIETRKGNSGSKFSNGDTLFARITPCLENGKTGYVQFLPSDKVIGFGSTEFIVLRSNTLVPEYVYLMARSNEFRDNAIKSMSGATGRQRVQEECFTRFQIAHPDPKTLQSFRAIVSPMFRSIQLLADKNVNLRQTRDLLLPKLISGELDVENLDIRVPAEADAPVAAAV